MAGLLPPALISHAIALLDQCLYCLTSVAYFTNVIAIELSRDAESGQSR